MATNEDFDLNDLDCEILDGFLNIPSVYAPPDVSETVAVTSGITRAKIEEAIEALIARGIITKADTRLNLNPTGSEKAKDSVKQFLVRKDITLDSATVLLDGWLADQTRLSLYVVLLGKIYQWGQQPKVILFSDWEWNAQPGPAADELVKSRLAFLTSSQSKKHSYRSYYPRSWPFDSEEVLRRVIFKHLNVEGLSANEWRIISLLLLSEYPQVDYDTIRQNTPFPEHELREIITELKRRGLVNEPYAQMELNKALRAALSTYYTTDVYPRFRAETVAALKTGIVRSLSNLWPFTIAKRISELPDIKIRTTPFTVAVVDKNRITQYESQFQGMKQLGLMVESKDSIILYSDIVKDVENWLRNSVKRPTSFIPAKDMWLARSAMQAMFAECREYVRIQDAYVGEDTFHLLQYVPGEIELQLMTGTKPGGREDPARIAQVIERFAAERKENFKIAFLAKSRDQPVFHDRFILTKEKGWSIGTSLKDIGKGDDTSIFEIPREQKDELFEQAFEKWWDATPSDLAKKGITKLSFDEWRKL